MYAARKSQWHLGQYSIVIIGFCVVKEAFLSITYKAGNYLLILLIMPTSTPVKQTQTSPLAYRS